MIRVYIKEKLVRSYPVKWEKRFEAFNKLYAQYYKSINKGE